MLTRRNSPRGDNYYSIYDYGPSIDRCLRYRRLDAGSCGSRSASGGVCRVSVPASTGSEGAAGYCFSQSTDHRGKNWTVKINGADRVTASATKKAHRSEHCCDRDRAGATGDAAMGAGLASTDVLCAGASAGYCDLLRSLGFEWKSTSGRSRKAVFEILTGLAG